MPRTTWSQFFIAEATEDAKLELKEKQDRLKAIKIITSLNFRKLKIETLRKIIELIEQDKAEWEK
jgi:hypothetical protein